MLPTLGSLRGGACALLVALLVTGCGRSTREPSRETPPATDTPASDSLAPPADSAAAPAAATAAHFARWPVRNPKHLAALVDSLGPERWLQALKLNRVDAKHVHDRDTLVLPDAFGDSLALSPFPAELAAVRDSGKVVLVSRRVQAFAAYEHGRLMQWGPVSTGRRAKPTPAGLYHATWKAKSRISTVDDEWLLKWCVNIHNREGVSLHEYELPGRPASHSCVRMLETDARWVYAWTDQWKLSADGKSLERPGTPVVVFGEWAWGARAPWKQLPDDPSLAALGSADLDEALRTWSEAVKPDFTVPPGTPADVAKPSTPAGARADSTRVRSASSVRDSASRRGTPAPPEAADSLRAPDGARRPR